MQEQVQEVTFIAGDGCVARRDPALHTGCQFVAYLPAFLMLVLLATSSANLLLHSLSFLCLHVRLLFSRTALYPSRHSAEICNYRMKDVLDGVLA